MTSVAISMLNPGLPGAPATIYANVSAALNLVLTNTTGDAIGLAAGAQLEIFMPRYFSNEALQKMSVDQIAPSAWRFSRTAQSLLLSWTGGTAAWENGATIAFTIGEVLTGAAPDTDAVQVNLDQLSGAGVPPNVSATLVLTVRAAPGNADLRKTLQVDNQYGGAVYVSTDANVLTNTLYLTLRNTGDKPLFHGATLWSGNPQVQVSFIYGTTSGALAPADKQQSARTGSAWGIAGAVFNDQTGGWRVQNPRPTDQANTPVWTLMPVATNQQIIGTGDQSTITFVFSNVVSLTPVGATQMLVQLSGFMADEKTLYDDTVLVVPLAKQNPPNPGPLAIYCLEDHIKVSSETERLTIPLTWKMFDVGSVKLSFYAAGLDIPEQKYSYGPAHPALNYDTEYPQVTGIKNTQLLTVYCSAYSDTQWLNKIGVVECSVPLLFAPVINCFSISPATIAPPHSYAFLLEWSIKGEQRFELVAKYGSASPTLINLPQTATSYIDHPTVPETVYTLNLYGSAGNQEEA